MDREERQGMNEADEITRTFKMSGRVVPSITDLLKEFGFIDDEYFKPEHRERGQRIHTATHYLDDNDLRWQSVRDEDLGFMMAYKAASKALELRHIRSEERLFHPFLMYCGKPDRVSTWNLSKGQVVIEIKTGSVPAYTGLQTAGQDLLLPTLSMPRERAAIELHNDGSWKPVFFSGAEHEGDRDVFLGLVAAHWYKINHGIKGRTS